MARYLNEIKTNNLDNLSKISDYLLNKGFNKKQQKLSLNDSQIFFKKGLFSGPQFIKISQFATSIKIEAWVKIWIFGLSIGELDLEGRPSEKYPGKAFGLLFRIGRYESGPLASLRNTVREIERLLAT